MGIVASREDAYSQCMANLRIVTTSDAIKALNRGDALRIDYTAVRADGPTPSNDAYCRAMLIETGERRRTLAKPARATKIGMFDIQLCIPRPFPAAAQVGYQMADLLKNATIGQTAGVVFYKSFVRAMNPDAACFIWRITATTNYDVMEG